MNEKEKFATEILVDNLQRICCDCKRELPENWDMKMCPKCEKLRWDAYLEGVKQGIIEDEKWEGDMELRDKLIEAITKAQER